MGFVDEIRERLKSDPRSSTELGRDTGIHPVNLRQFKAGTRSLVIDDLERLADALGVEITLKKKRKNP